MLAPDVQFMVHSSEIIDFEGFAHRGSQLKPVEKGKQPPEWRLRDFAFAAYSSPAAQGVREIHLAERSIWAFAAPREHCEEIVVFRKGCDTRQKWDKDAMQEPKMGLDSFFIMRSKQINSDTPLFKQFNGEWGFWESFFVPICDETQTFEALSLMDPGMSEDFFSPQRLDVTCHKCPPGVKVLTVPDDLVVRYEVTAVCKDMEQWSELCCKIGEDMVLTGNVLVEHKHLKPGDECVEAYHENSGIEEHSRLLKRDFEQMKLPLILKFVCHMKVAEEWKETCRDMVSLVYKYDALSTVYQTNLMGGWSSLSGARADPWNPMARLAVSALCKVFARYPEIRTMLDCGCGDMAWMQYVLNDHPMITYVGMDICAYCLANNFRHFPKLQFIQTDCSNLSGIEVMPQGMDLIVCKDFFNHMVLPDAVNAMKRLVALRPRFMLTHIHTTGCDNTGWERRIDKHLHYTRWNYHISPFWMPFPVAEVQQISEDQFFVLYEITPEDSNVEPPRIERAEMPSADNVDAFSLVKDGEMYDAGEAQAGPVNPEDAIKAKAAEDAIKANAADAKHRMTTAVTDLPDKEVYVQPIAERRAIKGIPAIEFRARCDLIFEKYDKDKDQILNYEEIASVMDAGGRKIEEYDAYASLCTRLGVDPAVGLNKKDLYKMLEKAPQTVWEEVYRSVNPLAEMATLGAETLPEAHLEKSLPNFLFEDGEQYAKVYIEVNAHMFYGAAEIVTDDHVKIFFGKQRMEVHIVAPGSYGSPDLYIWKLIVTPLSGEVVPEDCIMEMKSTEGREGSKKITIKLMKSKKKKWYNVGQAVTGKKL